jgi:cytochrome P450
VGARAMIGGTGDERIPITTAAHSTVEAPLAPHPRDLPLLGSLPAFAHDTLGAITEGWRQCGDVVRFRGPRPMTLVAHPDDVRHVLEERVDVFPRSDIVQVSLAPLVGSGLFTVAPEQWRRRRRLVAPAYHGERIGLFAARVVDLSEGVAGRWERQAGSIVDIREEMTALGLEIAEAALLGSGDERFRGAFRTAAEFLIPKVMSPVNPPDFLPPARRARAALRVLEERVQSEIGTRRRGGGDDLLAVLVEARDPETGDRLDDREVRDDALTFLFGAYKGIAQALMWTWFQLDAHPDEWTRVHEEAVAALGAGAPLAERLPQLAATRRAVQETIRLTPPLWIWSRQADEDTVVHGYRVPKGEFAICVPYVTHRHPEFWDRPETFDPSRFEPEVARARHPFAYFPFGAGPRNCPADELALAAAQIVVATLIRRVRLRLAPGHVEKRDLEFIFRPAKGMPMRIERL